MRREVRVPIYWLMVGVAVAFISPLASIWASVKIANSNRERAEHVAQLAQTEAREEARLRACGLFTALLDSYVEAPPGTETGRKVQETYLSFYKLNRCQPPRTR